MSPAKVLDETVVALDALEGWLSISQAAREIGKGTTWVRILLERGTIRAVQTSLGWLVDPDSVSAYCEGS